MKLPKTSIILLAGGVGTRMQAAIPKQFIQLKEKLIAQYSLDLFQNLLDDIEIVIVCDPQYRSKFSISSKRPITFAEPGLRRQDSVYNGFCAVSPKSEIVCIHDAARPFITNEIIRNVISAAHQEGAATAAVPMKSTIKVADANQIVVNTPERSKLWEIQTPQAIRQGLLAEGFAYAIKHNITVTDDVSLVELIQKPVKLVTGSYSNIKITTPDDLMLAECFLQNSRF